MSPKDLYEFGPFRLDPALNRLERDGHSVSLAPKAFDLLLLLARNTHRVLSKTELLQALWPSTFVEEANLTQHVYTLRKALGDQGDGQPYIETVSRRGYRLAASVRHVVDDPSPLPPSLSGEPARPADVVGERKHATVLDCRVADASGIVERLGPAALPHVVGVLSSVAGEEIATYEGMITERHADGFVALFGAPVVHEDDAQRGVLAALAIERRFAARAAAVTASDEPIPLRIGIGTGSVVVSRANDRGDYSAVGEALRLADLLQQTADPGTVLIGETTQRAVDGFIEVVPAPARIGGTSAFRVVARRPGSAVRPARFARRLSRFVGRSLELSTLDALAARVRDGRGQAVSIQGEPGIGKSRLVHEFAVQAAAPAGMALLEARCLSYGRLIPYLPVADLVRAHCGVGEAETADGIRRAVERTVADHGLSGDAGAWLLRLLGLTDEAAAASSPEAVKAHTFDALRALFFKASRRTPLLIIVEDVHWIDPTSEEFLTTLIERLTAARMMVVATCRPGYRVPWFDRSYLTQITLTPLSTEDGAQLVESVAHNWELPEIGVAAIVKKGEGNPFFLEELARSVVERGTVLEARDRIEAQTIPDTVQGVIMARIDRLPDRAKGVLQTASVIGREIPLQWLERMCEGADHRQEIAELCRLEFLYERTGDDDPVLVFKHALTQDVAYDSLLARRRRELHLRAAEALGAMYGDGRDDLAATFAYHYSRTDRADLAVHWLTRAADQAARVYANAEAIQHLELAARRLQRMADGPERDRRMIDVALRHAHSLYFLGRFRESVDVLLPHEARLGRLSDPALAAAYSFWLAHMHSRLGDQRKARDSAARAIEAATRAGDEETLGKAHGLLALEGHWSGDTAEGIARGRASVRLLRSHPRQRWWQGMAHFYLAMNHLTDGDFDQALNEAARADGVGQEIRDPRLQTYAGFTIGWVEATRGHHDLAVAATRRSREQAPDRVSRAYASMVLGYALLEQGRHEEARAILEPAVGELEGFSFPQWHGFSAALTAETYRLQGRLDDAAATIARAIAVTTGAQYWYGVGFAQRISSRILRDRGAAAEALATMDQAACTFDRIGAAYEFQRTRRELATLVAR